jgi:hypothetical protein
VIKFKSPFLFLEENTIISHDNVDLSKMLS